MKIRLVIKDYSAKCRGLKTKIDLSPMGYDFTCRLFNL